MTGSMRPLPHSSPSVSRRFVLAATAWAAALALWACTPLRAQTIVTVDLDKRHQTIEGFGACLISWDPDMERLYASASFLDAYLGQLGASMLRINLWGPSLPDPVPDWHDISFEHFKPEGEGHRVAMFLAAAKEFRMVDPALRLIGTVWSPPAWMKENHAIVDRGPGAIDGASYAYNGSKIDNRVSRRFYPHFVKWLVEMAKMHKAQGVPLYAISPGNEVMFTQAFESCVWDADDFAQIVGMLGEQLAKEGLGDVLIYGPETMTSSNWGKGIANDAYVQAIAADPKARRYLTRWATHGYTDGFTTDTSKDSARQFWNTIAATHKPFWITECGTGSHDWPAALNGIGAMIHNALVDGNASAFLPWQAAEKKPDEHALLVADKLTAKSRAAQHWFKFVRPGAVRVETTPATGVVPTSAFVHDANNTLTIVLVNPTRTALPVTLALTGAQRLGQMQVYRTTLNEAFEQQAAVAVQHGKIFVTMPPESMVTLHGKPLH